MVHYKKTETFAYVNWERNKIFTPFVAISSIPRKCSPICAEKRNRIMRGKKVISQPPIVQVIPIKMITEVCNFHHKYTSTRERHNRGKKQGMHCKIFKEFSYKFP